MHVLVVPSWYPSPEEPLAGTYFREQVEALSEKIERVGVLYPHLRKIKRASLSEIMERRFQVTVADEDGVGTVRVQGWNVPMSGLRKKIFAYCCEKGYWDYREAFGEPDLIHAHGMWRGGLGAARLKARHSVPYVVTEHVSRVLEGKLSQRERELIKVVGAAAGEITAVSQALAGVLEEMVGGQSVVVVPNMVDIGFFSLPEGGACESSFRFLAVGRLDRKKGFDLLIRAFARVFGGKKDVALRIVGDGEERARLEKLAEELSVRDHVEFQGRATREEVREEMWGADVFVLSSRVETFGIVLIEAMATGLRVVATKCGGPQEIVPEKGGVLCEPGSVSDLARGLRVAYKCGGLRDVKKEGLRNYVVENYSVDTVIEQLIQIYKRVI